MPSRHTRGFTLVEIIIIIGVAAVLLAVLIPAFNRADIERHDAEVASVGQAVLNAMDAVKLINNNTVTVTGCSLSNKTVSFTVKPTLAGTLPMEVSNIPDLITGISCTSGPNGNSTTITYTGGTSGTFTASR